MGEERAEKLRQNYLRAGTPVPPDLYPPELALGLESHYIAFQHLSTTRPLGMNGPGQISWLSIEEYADRLGFPADVRQDLHHHVRELDAAYLKWYAKKSEEQSKKRKPASGSDGQGQRAKGRSRTKQQDP